MTFDPGQYEERSALLLAQGQVVTTWTSHCDTTNYNAWIIAYNENSLPQTQILNLTPNGTQGSIWSASGLAADSNGFLYALIANGTFDTTLNSGLPSGNDYGNAAVKMMLTVSSNSLAVSDYFTPWNTVAESAGDIDYGSGSPLLLPDQVDANGVARHLLFTAGKDTNIYLLDRDNMGKFTSGSNSSADNIYQELDGVLAGTGMGNSMRSAPVYFNDTIHVGGNGAPLQAFALTKARLSSSPSSQSSALFSYPGTSPSISSNGSGNGIV